MRTDRVGAAIRQAGSFDRRMGAARRPPRRRVSFADAIQLSWPL